ncbi:MAG: hypothetical protein CMF54_07655 [Legionellales bacterium]|nr:hypothetical protein [Legionellales bacterium]
MHNSIKIYFIILLLIISSISSAQSLQEMNDLRGEYERLKKMESRGQEFQEDQNIDIIRPNPRKVDIFPMDYQIRKDSLDKSSYFFGYDFFNLRDSLAFWENMAPPNNYILGPGDEIIVYLWGETQLTKSYTINRDGKIYDDKVGVLSLTGKTIKESKLHLIDQFGTIYSTLKGRVPTTFLDISLGELKTININVVGKVKYPGVYPLHPYSNAITSLIMAGGVDTTGSLRAIKIIRAKKPDIEIDLYDYLIKGNLPENIQLRDQDIVFVPNRLSLIKIDSSIYRPGFYETKPMETVKDLINYAGGLKSTSSSKISIKRTTPIDKRSDNKSKVYNFYIDYKNSSYEKVTNGDIVLIRSILKTRNQVEIIGQVKRPGLYEYFPGMTLDDLIVLGGGFNDSTFWKSVYHEKAEIIRRDPNARYEKSVSLNLADLTKNNKLKSIKLQNLDRFVVHANLNFFEKKNVLISGEVNIPGSYPLLFDDEPLSSILKRAGSLTTKALPNGISIFREIEYATDFEASDENKIKNNRIRVAWNNESIIMMPGDSIVVKESTGTVNVTGEVYNPGLIEFKPGKSLNYYINASGGINDQGNKKGIIVIYANGVVSPKRWYSSPNISDGSTIVVNKKIISEPLDITQFATNWTSIISSLLTAILISQQIQN